MLTSANKRLTHAAQALPYIHHTNRNNNHKEKHNGEVNRQQHHHPAGQKGRDRRQRRDGHSHRRRQAGPVFDLQGRPQGPGRGSGVGEASAQAPQEEGRSRGPRGREGRCVAPSSTGTTPRVRTHILALGVFVSTLR